MYIGFPTRLVAVLVFGTLMVLLPGQGLLVEVKEFQVIKLVLRKSKKEEVEASLVQLETKLARSGTLALVPPLAKVPIRIKLLAGRLLPSKREMDRFVPPGSMGIRLTSWPVVFWGQKNNVHAAITKKVRKGNEIFGHRSRTRGRFAGQDGHVEGRKVMVSFWSHVIHRRGDRQFPRGIGIVIKLSHRRPCCEFAQFFQR